MYSASSYHQGMSGDRPNALGLSDGPGMLRAQGRCGLGAGWCTAEKMIKLFANSLQCTKEFAECIKYLRKLFGVHQRVCGVQHIFAQMVWSAPKSLRT
jgi:hypothetical protein